ncbi:MAG: GNAT family N-acetyltransferase [Lachnospiraceae bacterium]|nr:GNAT family N-acetyltransferase [Lachnospiraceae bacterium]
MEDVDKCVFDGKGECKMQYRIREATPSDVDAIVQIYNSNHVFLTNHLGRDSVNRSFILSEQEEMETMNFISCVITDESADKIVGVLDYKPDETVYLSIMMLDKQHQGSGAGRFIYDLFEKKMIDMKRCAIRIDVVDTYKGNALDFWKKQGFAAEEKVLLKWGEKESSAVVMRKKIK